MVGGSGAALAAPLATLSMLAWPDPAGVSGGDARAESRGLPWGDWKLADVGVVNLDEWPDSSSLDGTFGHSQYQLRETYVQKWAPLKDLDH